MLCYQSFRKMQSSLDTVTHMSVIREHCFGRQLSWLRPIKIFNERSESGATFVACMSTFTPSLRLSECLYSLRWMSRLCRFCASVRERRGLLSPCLAPATRQLLAGYASLQGPQSSKREGGDDLHTHVVLYLRRIVYCLYCSLGLLFCIACASCCHLNDIWKSWQPWDPQLQW